MAALIYITPYVRETETPDFSRHDQSTRPGDIPPIAVYYRPRPDGLLERYRVAYNEGQMRAARIDGDPQAHDTCALPIARASYEANHESGHWRQARACPSRRL